MTEYRGFRYQSLGGGRWKVIFPSGHKAHPAGLHDDAAVKAFIDTLIANLGE